MYLAPACTFWLLLGSLALELRPMLQAGAFAVVAAHPVKFACAAVMGFGVNSLAYIVIQTASSLTLKVLGTVKNAFVVWLGIFFLHESMTPLQGVGYAVSIAAFFWYQRIKMQQIAGSSSQPATPKTPAAVLQRSGGSGKYEAVASSEKDALLKESKEQV